MLRALSSFALPLMDGTMVALSVGKLTSLVKRHKFVLLAICLAFSTWIFIALSAPPAGFCGTKKSVLTDQYLKEAAVLDEIQSGNLSLGASKSPSEYILANPECCRVSRKERKTLWEKLFGPGQMSADFVVELNYKTDSIPRNADQSQKLLTSISFIDACGVLKETYVGNM